MLIPLFIRLAKRRQQELRVGIGGDRSAARVSMRIHASPTHRLTATILQSEMGERVKKEWGMDNRGKDNGNRKGDLFLNTFYLGSVV